MRTILILLTFIAMTTLNYAQNKKSFYDFKATTIDGQPFDLSTLKDKKVLVVNVVTFPMMAKISVKGKDIDPLYKWLTSKDENGVLDAPVKWNFQKFMIDEQGQVVDFAAPGDKPFNEKIISWIEKK